MEAAVVDPELVFAAVIVVGSAYGAYRLVKWGFGSSHVTDACSSDCGTVESGYGFDSPGYTESGNGGNNGYNLTGVTWPGSGDVGAEVWWDYSGAAPGVTGLNFSSSPASAPAAGWGEWMSPPSSTVTGVRAVCLYDQSDDVAAVWGDSYDTCGVMAPNQNHTLYGETTCTGDDTQTEESDPFTESDGTFPDLPIPECPGSELPTSIVVYERTYSPQTGSLEGDPSVVFSWTAPWGSDGPSDEIKACLLAAGTDDPCIATPTKYVDGSWQACSTVDCRGYPTTMPAVDDTDTMVTGTDGDTYGCSYGPIDPAPVGYCNAAESPGDGATSTDDEAGFLAQVTGLLDRSQVTTGHYIAQTDTELRTAAETIIEQCDSAAEAFDDLSESDCDSLPIFAPGQDVAQAAYHDFSAIWSGGQPSQLNWQPAESRRSYGWYTGMPGPCASYDTSTLDCDEYPFISTVQNWDGVSLLPIDRDDNRSEGRKLGSFYTTCGLNSGGPTAFLTVPVTSADVPTGVDTTAWCGS